MNRVLIDTQALIWFAEGSPSLSSNARAVIDHSSTAQLVSVASLWEMAIKIAIGKLTLKVGTLGEFATTLLSNNFELLPVLGAEAIDVATLPSVDRHKDPFDRLIAAQCRRYNLSLVSIDTVFDAYGVSRIW